MQVVCLVMGVVCSFLPAIAAQFVPSFIQSFSHPFFFLPECRVYLEGPGLHSHNSRIDAITATKASVLL